MIILEVEIYDWTWILKSLTYILMNLNASYAYADWRR